MSENSASNIVLLFLIMTNFPGIGKEQNMQRKYKINEIETFFSEDFLILCLISCVNVLNGLY